MICNCCKNVVASSADVCPSCGNNFNSWFGDGKSYPPPSAAERKAAHEARLKAGAERKAKREARKARVEEIGEEAVVKEETDQMFENVRNWFVLSNRSFRITLVVLFVWGMLSLIAN